MPTLLAYLAVPNGAPTRASLEVLTRCRQIADAEGWDLGAVILTPARPGEAGALAAAASRYGARTVYTVSHPTFRTPLNVPVLDALATVIERVRPSVVAFPSTEGVKDVLGALAVRTGGLVLPDVGAFEVRNGGVEAVRPVMAAKFMARTRAEMREGVPVLLSVRSGLYAAEEAPAEPVVQTVDFAFSEDRLRQTLRDVATDASGAVDLSDARVVVAAGRGVKDDEGKRLVEALAAATGAAIGASRAVVESGMFPATAQIGQTGKVVSPDVYFAVGLSGAIQHVAGMINSRVIVAINTNPDAPIFDVATYGIVGDLYEVLPPLIEQLRNARATA